MLSEQAILLGSKLTPLQRKYVINLVGSNMSQREAYVAAGGKSKTEQAQDASASRILSDIKVKTFYEQLMQDTASGAVLTRTEALEVLTEVARTAEKPRDKIGAVKQTASMEGWNAERKHKFTGGITVTKIEREIID